MDQSGMVSLSYTRGLGDHHLIIFNRLIILHQYTIDIAASTSTFGYEWGQAYKHVNRIGAPSCHQRLRDKSLVETMRGSDSSWRSWTSFTLLLVVLYCLITPAGKCSSSTFQCLL